MPFPDFAWACCRPAVRARRSLNPGDPPRRVTRLQQAPEFASPHSAKTGAAERKIELGSPALIGPITAGAMIYVVTDNAQLIALR